MTEKQGGSDLRQTQTSGVFAGFEGAATIYLLTGHKWFFSVPVSDGFYTLARTPSGVSCFFVPRILPDGSTNRVFIQRLKDKCGNRSNASSEENPVARLYREAPLNSIWEGTSNMMCMDVLRALRREEGSLDAFMGEVSAPGAATQEQASFLAALQADLSAKDIDEGNARSLVTRMALALQASELLRHSPEAVALRFIESRLAGRHAGVIGTLGEGPAISGDECERVRSDLGHKDVLILRNHGLLACGRTIPQAFNAMYWLENACRIQVDMLGCGRPVHQASAQAIRNTVTCFAGTEITLVNEQETNPVLAQQARQDKGGYGGLEWSALLRKLDRLDPSYRS